MLEMAIEIEGLLRIIRDGNPGPEVFTLLKEKSAELAALANQIKNPQESAVDSTDESEEESVEIAEGVPLSELEEESSDESFEESEEEALKDEKTESEDESIEDEFIGEKEDEDDDIMLAFDVEETDTESKEPEMDKTEEETGNTASHAVGFKRDAKLKSLFSLNDRYLYSRELFDGNMKMFDSTLEFIEGIEDFAIIEDYFYNELEWDPENQNVATFMEILRPRFKE